MSNFIASQLLGDDAIISFVNLQEDEVAQVIERAASLFELDANAEKQDVSNNTAHYLQRFFDIDIFIQGTKIVAGSYPTVLALNTAMNPERFHDARKWDEKMEILRWIMILENCKHHPLFHEIVDFFIKGDKYQLGILIPGFLKRGIHETFKTAKTIRGFVPSYNTSFEHRGIDEFETVQYLRTLSKG